MRSSVPSYSFKWWRQAAFTANRGIGNPVPWDTTVYSRGEKMPSPNAYFNVPIAGIWGFDWRWALTSAFGGPLEFWSLLGLSNATIFSGTRLYVQAATPTPQVWGSPGSAALYLPVGAQISVGFHATASFGGEIAHDPTEAWLSGRLINAA